MMWSSGGGAKSSVRDGGGFSEDTIIAILADGVRGSRVGGWCTGITCWRPTAKVSMGN